MGVSLTTKFELYSHSIKVLERRLRFAHKFTSNETLFSVNIMVFLAIQKRKIMEICGQDAKKHWGEFGLICSHICFSN